MKQKSCLLRAESLLYIWRPQLPEGRVYKLLGMYSLERKLHFILITRLFFYLSNLI